MTTGMKREHKKVIVPSRQAEKMACIACLKSRDYHGLSISDCSPGCKVDCGLIQRTVKAWRSEGMVDEDPVSKAKQMIKELKSGRDNSTVGFYEAIHVLKEGFERLLEERENR